MKSKQKAERERERNDNTYQLLLLLCGWLEEMSVDCRSNSRNLHDFLPWRVVPVVILDVNDSSCTKGSGSLSLCGSYSPSDFRVSS